MLDTLTLKTGSGAPLEEVTVFIENFLRPTQADKQFAGEIVRSGIRDRTASGVDARGVPFAPYNETRPYYFHVASGGGKFSRSSPYTKRSGGSFSNFGRFGEPVRRFTRKAERAAVSRLIKKLTAAGTTVQTASGGTSIRFPSYGAFKRAFGRQNVDLMGVSAPNMLDSIVVTPEEDGVRIGIYDNRAATIAKGHTTANRPKGMPLRQFFGIGTEDIEKIKQVLAERIRERMRNRL